MKNRQTALTLRRIQPRNPFVAAARFRQAGMHGKNGHALRQQGRRALQREVEDLHPPHS
ncbi:hypothetical protein [uncultured Methylibium sp.]|uniref:hypothetical protein n=1 Tax=uncultured Methylibium sp. TaxID=381093 RepID=UPI0025D97116|nr:hypothetical protein [uncultured Methylibium sp.]